ncbi:MAG: hypothetical protein ACLFP8_03505 [Alphaproteobacteria bacterium]
MITKSKFFNDTIRFKAAKHARVNAGLVEFNARGLFLVFGLGI